MYVKSYKTYCNWFWYISIWHHTKFFQAKSYKNGRMVTAKQSKPSFIITSISLEDVSTWSLTSRFFWLIRNCRHFVSSHGCNISICQHHSYRICTHACTQVRARVHAHTFLFQDHFFLTLKPISYITYHKWPYLYLPGLNNQSNLSQPQHSFAHHSWPISFQVCSNL